VDDEMFCVNKNTAKGGCVCAKAWKQKIKNGRKPKNACRMSVQMKKKTPSPSCWLLLLVFIDRSQYHNRANQQNS